jgi:hypothetical protein
MKPKMELDADKDLDGYSMINRAGSILSANGLKYEAKKIHQEATICGYDIYMVYYLLKKYMDI